MTILEALQGTTARVSYGSRWLVYSMAGEFTVYEARPYAKNSKVLIFTDDEELAVQKLIGDQE